MTLFSSLFSFLEGIDYSVNKGKANKDNYEYRFLYICIDKGAINGVERHRKTQSRQQINDDNNRQAQKGEQKI